MPEAASNKHFTFYRINLIDILINIDVLETPLPLLSYEFGSGNERIKCSEWNIRGSDVQQFWRGEQNGMVSCECESGVFVAVPVRSPEIGWVR